jgi:hypothetical protein
VDRRISPKRLLGNHRVFEHADSLDFDFHLVPRTEKDGRFASRADSGWSPGEDQIARMEGCDLGDQLRDGKDQLPGAGILHGLAVDPKGDLQLAGVGNFVGRDQMRSDGSKRIESLPQQPLAPRFA